MEEIKVKSYYKNALFILILLFILIFSVSCQDKKENEEKKIYKYLCGVWYVLPDPERTVERDFSWGKGQVVINSSIEIDLGAEPPTIFIGGIGGPFNILSTETLAEDILKLKFYFDRGEMEIEYIIHLNDDGSIWFEPIEGITFIGTGKERQYYKISAPEL
jgi:hypothetical protein